MLASKGGEMNQEYRNCDFTSDMTGVAECHLLHHVPALALAKYTVIINC